MPYGKQIAVDNERLFATNRCVHRLTDSHEAKAALARNPYHRACREGCNFLFIYPKSICLFRQYNPMEEIMTLSKITQWADRHKFLSYFLIIIFVFVLFIFKPLKPTNPSNPLFIESWFRVSDYNFNYGGLKHALKILFPVGTPKDYVDLMLVERGNLETIDNTSTTPGFFGYYYRPFRLTYDPWRIDVYYNEDMKLDGILLNREVINGDMAIIEKRHQDAVKGAK